MLGGTLYACGSIALRRKRLSTGGLLFYASCLSDTCPVWLFGSFEARWTSCTHAQDGSFNRR